MCVKAKQKRLQRHHRIFKLKLYLLFGICVSVSVVSDCASKLSPRVHIANITIDYNIVICITTKIERNMPKIYPARMDHREATAANFPILLDYYALY